MSEENKPKFPPGMNFEPNGWGSKISRFLKEKNKTAILPIIAVLILAGGTYYYFQNQVAKETPNTPFAKELNEQKSAAQDQSKLTLEEAEEKTAEEETGEAAIPETEKKLSIGEILKKPFAKDEEEKTVKEVETPPVVQESIKESIAQKAERGEGVTHLARKALKEYLTDKEGSIQLSAEQKIYVEDFLKDAAGSRPLEIGEEITFSVAQIDQAVALAQDLTYTQIQNLSKYVPFVPSLNY